MFVILNNDHVTRKASLYLDCCASTIDSLDLKKKQWKLIGNFEINFLFVCSPDQLTSWTFPLSWFLPWSCIGCIVWILKTFKLSTQFSFVCLVDLEGRLSWLFHPYFILCLSLLLKLFLIIFFPSSSSCFFDHSFINPPLREKGRSITRKMCVYFDTEPDFLAGYNCIIVWWWYNK